MDAIGAGKGETVLVLDEGNGARQILEDASARVELTAELRICTQQILNSKTGTGTFSYKFYKTFAPGIHARSDPKIHLRRPQRL